MMQRQFGLIGYPLSHSFSKKYFTEKFEKEGLKGFSYELFPIEHASSMPSLFDEHPNLEGLNVTIPHKEKVIDFLDSLDSSAMKIGAVNVIKKVNSQLIGYNSDYYGFKHSLVSFLGETKPEKALILGTGGASKAVMVALNDLGIEAQMVSRTAQKDMITYQDLKTIDFSAFKLIVNCSPLGTFPKIEECPEIPYHRLDDTFFLYDLVYNPSQTTFMKKGEEHGAKTINGYEMLVGQ
ncbi:MAG: shikimate dehydrogenase, partial [Cytophagales bacterium]